MVDPFFPMSMGNLRRKYCAEVQIWRRRVWVIGEYPIKCGSRWRRRSGASLIPQVDVLPCDVPLLISRRSLSASAATLDPRKKSMALLGNITTPTALSPGGHVWLSLFPRRISISTGNQAEMIFLGGELRRSEEPHAQANPTFPQEPSSIVSPNIVPCVDLHQFHSTVAVPCMDLFSIGPPTTLPCLTSPSDRYPNTVPRWASVGLAGIHSLNSDKEIEEGRRQGVTDAQSKKHRLRYR